MKIKIMLFSILLIILLASNTSAMLYSNVTLENTTLDGNNSFTDRIYIKGRVTISEGSTLTINEGTEIIFLFTDEEKDGIGDSEILSQGLIKILGSKEKPVFFKSNRPQKGSWLGLSIMNVDETNVIKNVVFEDSYMALHSHFSTLLIENCVFRNNFRGFQSQEGRIQILNSKFYNNDTALQFRNSNALLKDIEIWNNKGGLNFLYSDANLENVKVYKNNIFNIKIRYSKATLKKIHIQESLQNFYSKNSQLNITDITSVSSILRGVSFEESDVTLSDAKIFDNLLDGISIDNTKLSCSKINYRNNGRYDFYIKGNSIVTNECLKTNKEKIYGVTDDFSSKN